jgi:hypothetical protein
VFFGLGEVPVSNEPVLPEAGQAVRGQQDVCLAVGGVPRGGADSRHPSRHSWQRLSRTECTNQVTLLYPSPNPNIEHLVFVWRVEESRVLEQIVVTLPALLAVSFPGST